MTEVVNNLFASSTEDISGAVLEFADSQIDARNQWLEAKLNGDPNRPLPGIVLQEKDADRIVISFPDMPPPRTGDSGVQTSSFVIQTPEGDDVGYLVLKKPEESLDKKRHYYIGDIGILKQKHGYGPAAYLAILKSLPAGVGLRTEGVLSGDAKRVWSELVDRGVAKPSDKGGTPTAFETVF